jgi:hypothetical protein
VRVRRTGEKSFKVVQLLGVPVSDRYELVVRVAVRVLAFRAVSRFAELLASVNELTPAGDFTVSYFCLKRFPISSP